MSIEDFFKEEKGITVDAAFNSHAKYTAIDICKFAVKYHDSKDKILKYEEINRKNNQHVDYSESYEVKFWIQEEEFWVQKTEMYFGKTKGEHQHVFKRWKDDYNKQNVKYISITYQ